MGFPKPPMTNRDIANSIPTPPGMETTYVKPTPHVIPAMEVHGSDSALTENEVSMILRTSLIPEHHRDPIVIKFIACYVRCRDVRQASRDAGIHAQSGLALRSRPDIHEAITRITEKSVMKYGFDAAEVVEKVKEIAAIDPIDLYNEDGSFKSMHQMSPETRRAIKKFKVKSLYDTDPNGMQRKVGELIEVELWDKQKALEMLGREKDLFKQTTKVEHDVTKNMASVLLDSKRRGEEHSQKIIDVTPMRSLPQGGSDEGT